MCYYSGRLYTVEERKEGGPHTLAVYSITDQDTVTLLHALDLHMHGSPQSPRVDHRSGWVYIPCKSSGVYVVRYDGSKLVLVAMLKCVRQAESLAVVSTNTLYVCDRDSKTVWLVDVAQDRIIARLQPPGEVIGVDLYNIAVLGDTVLVEYGGPTLVLYRHGVPTPGKLVPKPQGLDSVWGLITDHHSSFLVTDYWSSTVSILNISGNLTHTIPTPGNREPVDCTVVGRQLWVGCFNGNIIAMSSQ